MIASDAVANVGTSLSNYSINYLPGNLIVNPAVLNVTADSKSITYGAVSLPALTYVVSGFKNGDSLITGSLTTGVSIYNGTAGSASNVGNYPINLGSLSAGSNYSINFTSANLAVTPATLTVTANSQSATYGTAHTLGTSAFTPVGLVNGDTISSVDLTVGGISTIPGTTNAGSYAIVSGGAQGVRLSNYNITYQAGVLTINPKPINVVANSATMVYADSVLPALSYQAVTGLVNGDQLSGNLSTTATPFNGSAGSASNVGTYQINQGTLTAGSNYAINYTPATLTVTPASLTITANDQHRHMALLRSFLKMPY